MFEYVKLKELCTVNQGLQIPISKRMKEPGPNRYFYITVQFLKNNIENYYIENPPIATTCSKDEILMVRTGNTGQVITGVEGCFHNNFFKVKPNERIIPKYMFYVLKSDLMYKRILNAASGTTIPDLKHSSFYELDIPLPTIEIQKKISDLLECIDKKIETNSEINRNLEEQAKSIFKDRFLDFNPFGGVMPFDWRELTLADVSNLSAGGDKPDKVSSTPIEEFNIPIYSNGISNEGLYGFTDTAKIFEESVTVSARGTIGYVCLRQTPYLPIVRLVSLVPKCEYISAKYLYHWLESLHISGTGTTQLQLTVPDFKKTRIVVPTKDVVDDFTEIVSPIYDEILKNKVQNSRLGEVRDTLLPRLLSGELDVAELEI